MVKELCREGITTLNLSCVGTQTALVFFISHVTTISFASCQWNRLFQTPISKILLIPRRLLHHCFFFFFINLTQPLAPKNFYIREQNELKLNYCATKVPPFYCLHCTYLSPNLSTSLTSHLSWKHISVLFASFFASHSASGCSTFSGLLCLPVLSPLDNFREHSSAFLQ